ncbi:hypothetical protein G6O67_002586 [Ophiocordyceps sinensis]|uniref:chitinase n=1 Tax=Ophiocordyceps sinensis TaxID=72228 RepID=A0A8H4PUK6_9HYPO|nr:hypothetical protein G6O67_002586 [Ophiocordyceps sinensis]
MLLTSLFSTLPLLAQATVGSAAQFQPEEDLDCIDDLDLSSPVSEIHVQDNVERVKVNVNVPANNQGHARPHVENQAQIHAQPQTPVLVHAHAEAHVQAHDQAHIHDKAKYVAHPTWTGGGKTIAGQGSHNAHKPKHTPTSAAAAAAGKPSVKARPSSLLRKIALARPSAAPPHKGIPASPSRGNAPAQPSTAPPRNGTRGLMNMLYFANWNVNETYFDPKVVAAKGITHAIYAFASIADDGTVISSSHLNDVQNRWSSDTKEPGTNAYGCVKRLFILKKQNRNLKTLLSVGGDLASKQGKFSMAATEKGRKVFAKSAVKLATDWGMDGLDIDWESPQSPDEAKNHVLLLQECREALDAYAAAQGQHYHYLLTAATPAGEQNYGQMDLAGMDEYLDYWNLMTYDFAGGWDSTTGHQANIFMDRDNPASTKASTDQSIHGYIAAGVPARKINLGLPLYGRAFAKTRGLGASYTGVGGHPSREGTWFYRELPRPNAKVEYSEKLVASWSYGEDQELVTYDTVRSTREKARYILDQHLGGAFFWQAAGDRSGDDSLVGTMAASLGRLDDTENMLQYPDSPYDNIKHCMPEE